MSAKHPMQLVRRGGAILVASTAAMVVVTGTAYAYWTTSGGGNGTATAGTASNLTVGTAATVGSLYPGATVSGNVEITNPNPFPVSLTSVSFSGPTVDAGHAGCTTTGVTFAASSALPLSIPKQGGAAANTATVSFTATMNNTSLSACQGATFTAAYTLAAQSQ